MARYTQVPVDTFQNIQINAGVVLRAFDPVSGVYSKSDIIGATTGGNSFSSNPTYSDYFADVDNVPENTKQGKRIDSYDPALSTNFVTVGTALGKALIGAADIDTDNTTHIIPRNQLKEEDFADIWLVGDYSDKNGNTNGGYVAIHIKNALNTGGFQFQSTKNGKGQFSADFHGHYDIEDIDDMPFEIYIKSGADELTIQVGTQPSDTYIEVGEQAHFFASAAKTSTTTEWHPHYQWQVRALTDNDYSDISGKETPSLNIADVTASMDGNRYRCKMTNGSDVVYSNSALLTVLTDV